MTANEPLPLPLGLSSALTSIALGDSIDLYLAMIGRGAEYPRA